MGHPICAVTVVLFSGVSAVYLSLTACIKTATSSTSTKHCLALLNIILGDVVLYRFLKSAQSRVDKLTATAALLSGKEPPPHLRVKTE